MEGPEYSRSRDAESILPAAGVIRFTPVDDGTLET
jgi:hypothetical protein